MERISWVIKTPNGFLGKRRYSFKEGTTIAKDYADFKYARIFTRRQDAEGNCQEGDEVKDVKIILL